MKFITTHLITCFILVLIPYITSLSFNYSFESPRNQSLEQNIRLDGANFSNDGIQLTPDQVNQSQITGRVTYVKEFRLYDRNSNDQASFSTNFTFVIDSHGDVNYGYGFTFFLAQSNTLLKPDGNMGLPMTESQSSRIRFVAVEFDTFWNEWDPKYSNGTRMGDHVGISRSSLESDKYEKWLSNVTGGGLCHASIRYDPVSKNLNVSFTGFQNNTVKVYGLNDVINLKNELPESVLIGFSAASGQNFQKNILKSWSFISSGLDQTPDPVKGEKSKVGLKVGLSITVLFLIILSVVLWRWKRAKDNEGDSEELEFEIEMNKDFEMGSGPKRFSYHELAQSTGDFALKEKLGEGGFGGVYRGFLKESRTYVAVKRMSKTSKQGIKQYASEVKIISRLRHKNLVQLIGWCHEKHELLLVYEYMENGSLDSHLFKFKSLLAWETRHKIAHGLACALLYLHEEWEQCVVHRDIKSSNVMLDSNFNAKLGDFGLAKLVDHDKRLQTTMLAGTLGYLAPECVVTGKTSKESDVFSFGVVALELACGRKPIDYDVQEPQTRLIEWVWELYGTGTLLDAVDPRLGSDFKEEEIKQLMIIGLWCAHPDSNSRPSMRQVIQVLNSKSLLPILPSNIPVASYSMRSMSSPFGVSSLTKNQSLRAISNTHSSNQTTSSTTSSCSPSVSLLQST